MGNSSFFSRSWHVICLVTLFFCLSSPPALSDELLYSLSSSLGGSGEPTVNLNVSSASQLIGDSVVSVPLPSGRTVSGVIKRTLVNGPSDIAKTVISFGNGGGALELLLLNNTITGMFLHDADDQKVYAAVLDAKGRGVLREESFDDYQCANFPIAPNIGAVDIPASSSLIPDLSTLQNLESKPGASKTLYINYWGGILTGTAWNDNLNSGNDIVYTPYSYDADTTSFSDTERYLMWLGWQEAAEDYAAFDINVTTSLAIYNSSLSTNRSQIIATDTNYFYPGAGGVAYVGIFNHSTDYYKTGWVWNSSSTGLGMTISHEAGHQIGLGHDGTSLQGYYSGHGVWGPIMGAPFGREYVQWSKGEYPDANNAQDDFTIIANVLGTAVDGAGDSNATATSLLLPVTDYEGGITPDGLYSDVDVYSFSLLSADTTYIEVKPLLGAEGESRGVNLAMNVTLQDSVGNIIASIASSDNAYLDPRTNIFIYEGSLAADTYYLIIEAVSPDTNWATGFGEYGNGGEYRLTISAGGGGIPVITSPAPGSTLSGSSAIFIWDSNGVSVSDYSLYIGSSPGATDIYDSANLGMATNISVSGLPTDGRTLYITLWYYSSGVGWLSEQFTYTAANNIVKPGKPILVSPLGNLETQTPTFVWQAIGGGEEYLLYVKDKSGVVINTWYAAAEAGCAAGESTCSLNSAVALVGGKGWWRVRAKNSAGTGSWSKKLKFTVPGELTKPGKAILISPSGSLDTDMPTYIWQAVEGAESYLLYVKDKSGVVINTWYTAAEAGCAAGESTCSLNPAAALVGGKSWWRIRAKNSAGTGAWSKRLKFTATGL